MNNIIKLFYQKLVFVFRFYYIYGKQASVLNNRLVIYVMNNGVKRF